MKYFYGNKIYAYVDYCNGVLCSLFLLTFFFIYIGVNTSLKL